MMGPRHAWIERSRRRLLPQDVRKAELRDALFAIGLTVVVVVILAAKQLLGWL